MSTWLEKWAYIMIIVCCFTILLTLVVFLVCYLCKKKNEISCLANKDNESRKKCCNPKCKYCNNTFKNEGYHDSSTIFHNMCETKNEEKRPSLLLNSSNKQNSCKYNSYDQVTNRTKSDSDDPNRQIRDQYGLELNESSSSLNSASSPVNKQQYNYFDSKAEALSHSETEGGFFFQLYNKLKSNFTSPPVSNDETPINTYRVSLDNHTKSVDIIPNTNYKERLVQRNSMSGIKSSIKKTDRKGMYIRNSSLPSSTHSVKFKTTAKDEEKESSDEYVPQSKLKPKRLKSASVVSATSDSSRKSSEVYDSNKKLVSNSADSSRKNSSISSCYESSVVDLYRQKRFSDASSILTYSTNSSVSNLKHNDSRKFSINQPNHITESGIKLVALEQQQNIGPKSSFSSTSGSSKKSSIKSSLNSISNASQSTRLSLSSVNDKARRYSIMTPNVSEKFWVPPEIALSVQLEKQRSSIAPNSAGEPILEATNKEEDELEIIRKQQHQANRSENENIEDIGN